MASNDDPFAKYPDHRHRHGRGHVERAAGAESASNTRPSSAPPFVRHSSAAPFAERAKHLSVHPLENALLVLVLAHLVFLPWALGTMVLWAQQISLGLAIASFALALVPRTYTAEQTGSRSYRMLPSRRLLRFPIFWLGLALLALVTCHGLNPAWEFQSGAKGWWMHAIPHISWLPSGVRVPFKMWGPWRMLMIYSSAWMTVCAIWIGFTRRRTVRAFFITLAVNAVGLAIVGVAQRLGGATRIFWSVDSPNPGFFSSFIYKNHAGAYLDLALAATCGLAAWYYVRGIRRLEKSNPSGLFAVLSAAIAVSLVVSFARGATFIMFGYLLLVVAEFLLYQRRIPPHARNPAIAITMIVIVGAFVYSGLRALDAGSAWERLRSALSGEDLSVLARQEANQASLEALRDNWAAGMGSGSFRFLYPIYVQHHPEVAAKGFWEHAHNDILEIPMELGIAGMLIVLAGFAYWTTVLNRARGWQQPLTSSVVIGCLFLIVMAWGEFVFQCAAVLVTWCAFWPAAALWARLEEQRRSGTR